MMNTPVPPVLKLLAHEVRWHLLQLLSLSDYRVHELVAQVQRPQNLVSYHLRLLRDGGLVQEHRSSADGRDVYYTLNLAALRHAYATSGADLHPTLAPTEREQRGPLPVVRVLFLCTHNSARSLLAEALLKEQGGDRIEVASAGNHPTAPHPLTRTLLESRGIAATGYYSKDVSLFQGQTFDYTITLCDRMRESCPSFPDAFPLHWSLPDPAQVTDSPTAQHAAFVQVAQALDERIRSFLDWLAAHPKETP